VLASRQRLEERQSRGGRVEFAFLKSFLGISLPGRPPCAFPLHLIGQNCHSAPPYSLGSVLSELGALPPKYAKHSDSKKEGETGYRIGSWECLPFYFNDYFHSFSSFVVKSY